MMYNDTGKNVSRPHPSTVSAAAAVTTPRSAGIPYPLLHHHHHHQVRHPIMIPFSASPYLLPFSASASASGGADDDDDFPGRDERFPQWSNQETRNLIEIRAQFELEFTTAKRDRYLWEMVADGMRKKGYRRTPDQCKCKWEDLISRFKGQETTDVDNRQCPFSDELHAVFTARANRMHPPQPSITKTSKTLTNASEDRSHEDDMEVEQAAITRTVRRRKTSKEKRQKIAEDGNCPDKNSSVLLNSLDEMMRNFVEQQQRIDVQWRESMEKHAREREVLEEGWRRKMENLERERLVMENAWREREEQRRSREESRAEKRDALLTTLLNKLIREENH